MKEGWGLKVEGDEKKRARGGTKKETGMIGGAEQPCSKTM